MITSEYFKTPIWVEEKPEWVKPINKICDIYIEEAKKLNQEKIKKQNGSDFGIVHHSTPLAPEPKMKEYVDYIGNTSGNFLDWMGYDLKDHTLVYTEMWVQQFPKDGGGNHNTHVHPNNHVSGFFYLQVDKEGSYPVLHDPRPAACISALPQKNDKEITHATQSVHWKPIPGTLIIMPAYVGHQYVVSRNDPFRFIHFNIQAINNSFRGEKK